jgi:hypothetical protein
MAEGMESGGQTADGLLNSITESLGAGGDEGEQLLFQEGEGEGITLPGMEETAEEPVEEKIFQVVKPGDGRRVDIPEGKIRNALKIPEGEQIGEHHAKLYQQMLKMNYNSIEAGKLKAVVEGQQQQWGNVENYLAKVSSDPENELPGMLKLLKIPMERAIPALEKIIYKMYLKTGQIEGQTAQFDDSELENERMQMEQERQRLQMQQMEIQADAMISQIENTISRILQTNQLPNSLEDIQAVVQEIYVARTRGQDLSPGQAIKRLMSRTQRLTTSAPGKLLTPQAKQAAVKSQVQTMKQTNGVRNGNPTGTLKPKPKQGYISPDDYMDAKMKQLKGR